MGIANDNFSWAFPMGISMVFSMDFSMGISYGNFLGGKKKNPSTFEQ